MKTSLAALALAASAAAMPMSAANTTISLAATVTGTTTAPTKTRTTLPGFSSGLFASWLSSSIKNRPTETPESHISLAEPMAVPKATGVEPCVMPNGCRDEDKHDKAPLRIVPTETGEIQYSIAEPTAVPKATHGPGKGGAEACVMPDGCRDEDKHEKAPWWIAPEKAITIPIPIETHA